MIFLLINWCKIAVGGTLTSRGAGIMGFRSQANFSRDLRAFFISGSQALCREDGWLFFRPRSISSFSMVSENRDGSVFWFTRELEETSFFSPFPGKAGIPSFRRDKA